MTALAPVRRHWFPLFVLCAAAAALFMLPSAYSGGPSNDRAEGCCVSSSAVAHARHAVGAARRQLARDRAAGVPASVLAADHSAVATALQHLSDVKSGAHVAPPAPASQTTAQMAAAAMAAQAYEQYYGQQSGQQGSASQTAQSGQAGQVTLPAPVQALLDREMALQRQLPLFDSVAFEKTFVNTRDHLSSDAQNPPTTPTGAADALLTPLGEGLAIEGISYLPGMVGQLQRSVDSASQ